MTLVNYARLAVQLERMDDSPVAEALAEVVMARAEGARGLGARVDEVLEKLAEKLGKGND